METKKEINGRYSAYTRWPFILGIIPAVATVAAFAVDNRAGIVMGLFLIAYFAAAFLVYMRIKPRLQKDMLKFSTEHSSVQQELIQELELPYALLGEEGKILWHNKKMAQLFGENEAMKDISSIIPEIETAHLKPGERTALSVKQGENSYRAVITHVNIDKYMSHYVLYLFDETETKKLRREVENQKLVCGIIYVDNYDEALDSTDEVSRSLLAALVERKIMKYLQNFDAIVDKLEKDKYVFVLRNQHLRRLQSSKFSLLDDVREINIGNELSVTLSIGIGVNSDTYAQSYEWARHAIELALGRGGDQAVIKDRDKMYYYGGKSRQVEKSTRVRARVKAHALRQVIMGKKRIVVMGHRMGDVDCVGAGIGVYRAARVLNKEAHIVLNEISPSVAMLIEHFRENPEYGSEMFLNSEAAEKMVDEDTALIIVDVNTAQRTEAPALFDLTKTVVVIDHHKQSGNSIENPVLSYIEPYASSACEMVTEILQYIDDNVKLKPEEADALYAGIVIDTNNFLNETGTRTFEAAAFLKKNGADVTRVRLKLRDDMNTFKARAEAVKEAQIEGPYAYAVCRSEGLDSPTVVGAQIANELLSIKGIEASFVATKPGDTVFLSARSLETMNVQLIMEKLGGGGHTTIAGAQISGESCEEAIQKVKDIIEDMKDEGDL